MKDNMCSERLSIDVGTTTVLHGGEKIWKGKSKVIEKLVVELERMGSFAFFFWSVMFTCKRKCLLLKIISWFSNMSNWNPLITPPLLLIVELQALHVFSVLFTSDMNVLLVTLLVIFPRSWHAQKYKQVEPTFGQFETTQSINQIRVNPKQHIIYDMLLSSASINAFQFFLDLFFPTLKNIREHFTVKMSQWHSCYKTLKMYLFLYSITYSTSQKGLSNVFPPFLSLM